MPRAILTIIKQPTAMGWTPSASVILNIIAEVSRIMDVGSIRQPRINRKMFMISRTRNLLFTVVRTAVEMALPMPLEDIHQAMPAAEHTMISIEPTDTAVSAKHLQKTLKISIRYRFYQ